MLYLPKIENLCDCTRAKLAKINELNLKGQPKTTKTGNKNLSLNLFWLETQEIL
jgi:hypothetical protein